MLIHKLLQDRKASSVASEDFLKWMEKTKCTELDVIRARKLQNISITETENTFGITTISVCGFLNNDVTQFQPIVQHYDESKPDFYKRAYGVMAIGCELMDSVNEILRDDGAWSPEYFSKKLEEWYKTKEHA